MNGIVLVDIKMYFIPTKVENLLLYLFFSRKKMIFSNCKNTQYTLISNASLQNYNS